MAHSVRARRRARVGPLIIFKNPEVWVGSSCASSNKPVWDQALLSERQENMNQYQSQTCRPEVFLKHKYTRLSGEKYFQIILILASVLFDLYSEAFVV